VLGRQNAAFAAGVAAAAAPDLSITRCQELLQTLSQSDGVYQGLSLNGAVVSAQRPPAVLHCGSGRSAPSQTTSSSGKGRGTASHGMQMLHQRTSTARGWIRHLLAALAPCPWPRMSSSPVLPDQFGLGQVCQGPQGGKLKSVPEDEEV
jgi:hypothetical protein